MDEADKHKNIKQLIKGILSDHLGVEPQDLNDDDSFTDELHMGATEIADFVQSLSDANIDVSKIDFEETPTLGELLDYLSSEHEI